LFYQSPQNINLSNALLIPGDGVWRRQQAPDHADPRFSGHEGV